MSLSMLVQAKNHPGVPDIQVLLFGIAGSMELKAKMGNFRKE